MRRRHSKGARASPLGCACDTAGVIGRHRAPNGGECSMRAAVSRCERACFVAVRRGARVCDRHPRNTRRVGSLLEWRGGVGVRERHPTDRSTTRLKLRDVRRCNGVRASPQVPGGSAGRLVSAYSAALSVKLSAAVGVPWGQGCPSVTVRTWRKVSLPSARVVAKGVRTSPHDTACRGSDIESSGVCDRHPKDGVPVAGA